ncbi:hypothetical protein [Pseudomonas sp. Marseille-QA0892]
MRIDGYISSYPLDRPARTSAAGAAYREVSPVDEIQKRLPAEDDRKAEDAFTYAEVEASSEAGNVRAEHLPARYTDIADRYQQPLSARAAQALASYGSTANIIRYDDSASQIVGLDLYA